MNLRARVDAAVAQLWPTAQVIWEADDQARVDLVEVSVSDLNVLDTKTNTVITVSGFARSAWGDGDPVVRLRIRAVL